MNNSRTIFIGDIHGCYKEFKLLLKKINLNENDKVYLTGDLISKGPKSYKVLNYIYKNKEQFKSVAGNNELLFIKWIKGENKKIYNEELFTKLKNKIGKSPELLDFLESLPGYIEEENFILIHGGLIPYKALKEHSIEELTKIRDINGIPWYSFYSGDKKIIYGHYGQDGLRIRKNTIGIDTACVYGKRLTAYILETGEIIQQSALDIYINLYEDENQ